MVDGFIANAYMMYSRSLVLPAVEHQVGPAKGALIVHFEDEHVCQTNEFNIPRKNVFKLRVQAT